MVEEKRLWWGAIGVGKVGKPGGCARALLPLGALWGMPEWILVMRVNESSRSPKFLTERVSRVLTRYHAQGFRGETEVVLSDWKLRQKLSGKLHCKHESPREKRAPKETHHHHYVLRVVTHAERGGGRSLETRYGKSALSAFEIRRRTYQVQGPSRWRIVPISPQQATVVATAPVTAPSTPPSTQPSTQH